MGLKDCTDVKHEISVYLLSAKSIHPWQSVIQTILKAHGGEIKVETKENEGTGFIIQLPTT